MTKDDVFVILFCVRGRSRLIYPAFVLLWLFYQDLEITASTKSSFLLMFMKFALIVSASSSLRILSLKGLVCQIMLRSQITWIWWTVWEDEREIIKDHKTHDSTSITGLLRTTGLGNSIVFPYSIKKSFSPQCH